MSQSRPTVTVVICSYTLKRWKQLDAAVQRLQQQTYPVFQSLVVIDHNPELFKLAKAELQGVTVLANTQARGLSGARNVGIATAQGDVIAFMDEDALPAPDWLERLVQPYDDPRVMGVGGTIEPLWARPAAWFPDEFRWVVGCTYRGLPAHAAPVRNLIGCNMSLRRTVFEAVGGFRAEFGRVGTLPVGCEETELCIRAHRAFPDQVLLFEPNARVAHYVPAERSTFKYFAARCYAEGMSKAQVTRLMGARDGLASERAYTLRTLPAGVLRNLAHAVRHLDGNSVLRAGAIVAGLGITTVGYLRGKLVPGASSERARAVEFDTISASEG